MSETQPDAIPGTRGGALLREAREAAGVHVAALAVALKVPVRQLEALEQGRLDLLPDPTFARALASSVCRQLRIDPQPILAELPPQTAFGLYNMPDVSNEPFEIGRRSGPVRWLRVAIRPSSLVATALLLAALGLFFMPDVPTTSPPAPTTVAPAPVPAAAASSGMVVESVTPGMPVPEASPQNLAEGAASAASGAAR